MAAHRYENDDDAWDDDAWVEKLRGALASAADAAPEAEGQPGVSSSSVVDNVSSAPPPSDPAGWPSPLVVRTSGPPQLPAALQELGDRVAAMESLIRGLAAQPQPSAQRADIDDFVNEVSEAVVSRLGRVAEQLDTLVDRLDRGLSEVAAAQQGVADDLELWARQSASDDVDHVPPAHVAGLAREMRRRLGDLEDQQRHLVRGLAEDRQRLISEAVSEIRTMLFGK